MKHKAQSTKLKIQNKFQAPSTKSKTTFWILDFGFSPKGFTIIELLVVIAIAAMLLAGVMALFQSSRARARDATREEHIKTVQTGLAIYATARGNHPVYDGFLTGSDLVSTELVSADALPQMPRDPLNQGTYRYSYTSLNGSTYTLTYYLETNTISGKSAGVNTAGP